MNTDIRSIRAVDLEALRRLLHAADPLRSVSLSDLRGDAAVLCCQADPEALFPEKSGSARGAQKLCESCEAKAQRLAYALANDERFGVWAGLSPLERGSGHL